MRFPREHSPGMPATYRLVEHQRVGKRSTRVAGIVDWSVFDAVGDNRGPNRFSHFDTKPSRYDSMTYELFSF